jgi:hypothetical protein
MIYLFDITAKSESNCTDDGFRGTKARVLRNIVTI